MKNRQGSYKKILIGESSLKSQGSYLVNALTELKSKSFSPFVLTTLYILLFLRIRHPKNWLQKKSSSHDGGTLLLDLIPSVFALNDWEKEKLKDMSAYDLFHNCSLKGIPESINRSMKNWCLGIWNIKMLEYIPSAYELLELQVENARCITLITDVKKIDSLVLESRDPLSFVLHDLMHADQFWSNKESMKGQLGFYKRVHQIYKRPLLSSELKQNREFRKDFEYVASDMNAYSIHLFKCLKSSMSKTKKYEELFTDVLHAWEMDENEIQSAHRLNTGDFLLADELLLKDFFERGVVHE